MHITADGRYLYFGSDREGGLGGRDLWVSEKIDDEWGEPVNLGPPINTAGDEDRPFLSADGRELWFDGTSRKGHPGPAIFRSLRQPDGSWDEPKEIISSFAAEPTLTLRHGSGQAGDGRTLYFVHHYFTADLGRMIEADIYVTERAGSPLPDSLLLRPTAARLPASARHGLSALASTIQEWCDHDHDGFCFHPFGPDCDGNDPLTYPGAEEQADLKDDNCNGFGDEPPVGFVRQGYSGQGFASAVEWYGDYVYLAAGAVLQVYHAPPGSEPELVREIEFRDWVREMVVDGDTLFVAARGDGLFAFDLADDPSHPRLAGQVTGLFDAGDYTDVEAVFNEVDTRNGRVAVARANNVPQSAGGVDALVFDYNPASGSFTLVRALGTDVRSKTVLEVPVAVGLTEDASGLYIGYGVLAGELVYVPLDNPAEPVLHLLPHQGGCPAVLRPGQLRSGQPGRPGQPSHGREPGCVHAGHIRQCPRVSTGRRQPLHRRHGQRIVPVLPLPGSIRWLLSRASGGHEPVVCAAACPKPGGCDAAIPSHRRRADPFGQDRGTGAPGLTYSWPLPMV